MANRAMTAKVERAKRQAGALAQAEYSKPFYAGNFALTGVARDHLRAETAALVAAYQGKITKGPYAGRCYADRRGGFVADRSSIAPGTPVRAGIRYATNVTSKLIAR